MKAPNHLERLMTLANQDVSHRPALLKALLEESLWFPVAYHPELPALLKPKPGDIVPFWLARDGDGQFVPMFTSRSMLKDCLAPYKQRFGIATMPAPDACAALVRQGLEMRLNPDAECTAALPLNILKQIAARDLAPLYETIEASGDFRNLAPEQLPPDLLPKILEECGLQPDILGLWLLDLVGTVGPADLRHLHAVVWVRDRERTPTDNLAAVIRRACSGYDPEMLPFDAIHDAEQLATMRALPPIYERPPTP